MKANELKEQGNTLYQQQDVKVAKLFCFFWVGFSVFLLFLFSGRSSSVSFCVAQHQGAIHDLWGRGVQFFSKQGLGESAMNVAGGGGDDSSLNDEDRKVAFELLFGFRLCVLKKKMQVLKALTETLHLNLAACYLRTEQPEKCIKACTVAIGVNPNSAKV